MKKEDRQARKNLGEVEREMLELIEQNEKDTIIGFSQLCVALVQPIVTFMTFSCLGSLKGKEELRLDLFETYFFRSRKFHEAVELIKQLQKFKPVHMLVVLPDTEPRRTWGWNIPQEELTTACEMMIEDAEGDIPEGWEVVCWSALEAQADHTFTEALGWAHLPQQAVLVHQEAEHLRQFPDILFQGGVRAAAERQIAAYAHEGRVLEAVRSSGIFIQSESPFERKDRMYQPVRGQVLPIIHPFVEEK